MNQRTQVKEPTVWSVLLHHYLEKYGNGESDRFLHADNCVGQNENNAIMHYLLRQVLTKRSGSAELSFMLTGHTKFSPDHFLGLFKKVFRCSSVDTIESIAATVESSTQNKQNVAQLICDAEGRLQVVFLWLDGFPCSVFQVTTYHNFKACSTQPGKLRLNEFSNSEEQWQSLLKPGVRMRDLDAMPDRTTVPGLACDSSDTCSNRFEK